MHIRTTFVYPPIPIRTMDWQAIDDDIYDDAPDAGPQCVGVGKTEQEAIDDLLQKIEDR